MTEGQKREIIKLRTEGLGYKKISETLNISRDKVKYFCKCSGFNGYGKEIKEKYESGAGDVCKYCGKPIKQPKRGRRKKFCSAECKKTWGKIYHKLYEHKCFYCGKTFESLASKQNFCSKECYVRHRFYREDDISMIVECLKKGEKPKFVPGWIYDLLIKNDEEKIF